MTYEVAMSLVRQVLTVLGTMLVANGLGSDAQVQEGIGACVTIASVVWGIINHKNTESTINVALSLPQGSTQADLNKAITPTA